MVSAHNRMGAQAISQNTRPLRVSVLAVLALTTPPLLEGQHSAVTRQDYLAAPMAVRAPGHD